MNMAAVSVALELGREEVHQAFVCPNGKFAFVSEDFPVCNHPEPLSVKSLQ